ncbi:serine/threonine protein kinase [Minicystis rosea]|nr:serine/threonine protein kinase [Minicystis rosea]
MTHRARRIDPDLINLDGGLFTDLAWRVAPRESLPRRDENQQDPAHASEPPVLATATPLSMTTSVRRPRARRAINTSGLIIGVAVLGLSCAALAATAFRSHDAEPPSAEQAALTAEPAGPPSASWALPPRESPSMEEDVEGPLASIPPEDSASIPPLGAAPPALRPMQSTAPAPSIDVPILPPITSERSLDRSTATSALTAVAPRAARCLSSDASMSARISVTFAPSGRVTKATINGGPLAGTRAGSCVATMLRSASVPPFDGKPVTVNMTMRLR